MFEDLSTEHARDFGPKTIEAQCMQRPSCAALGDVLRDDFSHDISITSKSIWVIAEQDFNAPKDLTRQLCNLGD
jgi:hypothetical protein